MNSSVRFLSILGAVICWAIAFPLSKYALVNQVSPFHLVGLRFAITAPVFAILLVNTWIKYENTKVAGPNYLSTLPKLVFLGLSGVGFYFGMLSWALQMGNVSQTVLILSLTPAVTTLLAFFLLKEKTTSRQWIGIGIAILGSAVISSGTAIKLGDAMLLVCVFLFSSWTISLKLFKFPIWLAISATLVFGSVFLAILSFPPFSESVFVRAPGFSSSVWLAIVTTGLLASGLGYVLWIFGLTNGTNNVKGVNARTATSCLCLVPVIAIPFAIALLGETPAIHKLVGGLIAIFGVLNAIDPPYLQSLVSNLNGGKPAV